MAYYCCCTETDSLNFLIYKIVIAVFYITDQVKKIEFFEKTFSLANISRNVVIKMLFFILNGPDINF